MADNLKINEDYIEFQKKFILSKNSTNSFTKNHSIFSYECFKSQLESSSDDLEKKLYFVKKIKPIPEKLEIFENFINKFLDFQNTTITPALSRLKAVCKHEDTFYLVQRDYQNNLLKYGKGMCELEIWSVLREIVKFYSHIKEDEVSQLFLENNFPLREISAELVYYYRKIPKTLNLEEKKNKPQKIPRFKVKVDVLAFEKKEEPLQKLEFETFHLKEFELLVRSLLEHKKKLGISSINLLKLLGKNCFWKDLFVHPILRVDIANEPNFFFWKIEIKGEELGETMKVVCSDNKILEEKKEEPFNNENSQKNDENDPLKKESQVLIKDKNLEESSGLIKKSSDERKDKIQPYPLGKNIDLEDEENRKVDTVRLNNGKENKVDKECHCRCI